MSDLPRRESWDMGEKLRWHKSMETAKFHQLLRPCFEQRVGPDGLQIIPGCEMSSQGETKPRLLQAASVLEEKILKADPKDIPGRLQGREMLHCNPSQEEVAPLHSGVMGRRNSGARSQTSSRHFVFWPGKRSRSRELPMWEKEKVG